MRSSPASVGPCPSPCAPRRPPSRSLWLVSPSAGSHARPVPRLWAEWSGQSDPPSASSWSGSASVRPRSGCQAPGGVARHASGGALLGRFSIELRTGQEKGDWLPAHGPFHSRRNEARPGACPPFSVRHAIANRCRVRPVLETSRSNPRHQSGKPDRHVRRSHPGPLETPPGIGPVSRHGGRSRDLTAAVGVLATVLLLGAWGGSLGQGLLGLLQGALEAGSTVATSPDRAVDHLETLALAVVWPLTGILGGTLVAMGLAHALQTGGLWAPGLLAPDIARLWGASRPGWGRGLIGLLRSAVLIAAAAWMLRADWPALERLSRLDAPGMLAAAGMLARGFGSTMALGSWHSVCSISSSSTEASKPACG